MAPRHFPARFSSLRICPANTLSFHVFDIPWSMDQQRLPAGRICHSSQGSAAWHTHHTRTYCAFRVGDRARGQEDVNKCNLPKKLAFSHPAIDHKRICELQLAVGVSSLNPRCQYGVSGLSYCPTAYCYCCASEHQSAARLPPCRRLSHANHHLQPSRMCVSTYSVCSTDSACLLATSRCILTSRRHSLVFSASIICGYNAYVQQGSISLTTPEHSQVGHLVFWKTMTSCGQAFNQPDCGDPRTFIF